MVRTLWRDLAWSSGLRSRRGWLGGRWSGYKGMFALFDDAFIEQTVFFCAFVECVVSVFSEQDAQSCVGEVVEEAFVGLEEALEQHDDDGILEVPRLDGLAVTQGIRALDVRSAANFFKGVVDTPDKKAQETVGFRGL